ncbi:MAG: hypothetical protein V9E82_12150 [Candidatus Nanopelagicales bacterium]
MTALFTGSEADIADAFWTRMGMTQDPGWRVHLDAAAVASPGDLFLSDTSGVPLEYSRSVTRALQKNSGRLGVALADSDGRVYAKGVVGTRRTAARTVAGARLVAGPLAVMAAHRKATAVAPTSPVGRTAQLGADLAASGWFGLRLARAALTYREWACVTIRMPHSTDATLDVMGMWHSGPHRFWADPFVLIDSGESWLFMEELDRATGRGHLIAARIIDGDLRDPRVILSNDHHLSFPVVGRHQGRWIATVETCARHNPVYTFDRPGDPWHEDAELPALPPHTADAVADFDAGTLVGTDAATDGHSVLVRYALQGDEWVPQPDAVRVDIGWSRGGGVVDTARGIRAVQDCAGTYGTALGWTSTEDPDQHLARWSAADLSTPGWRGVHTMTWDPLQQQVWIDGWRRRVSPLGWRHRLVEQGHFAQCQG